MDLTAAPLHVSLVLASALLAAVIGLLSAEAKESGFDYTRDSNPKVSSPS